MGIVERGGLGLRAKREGCEKKSLFGFEISFNWSCASHLTKNTMEDAQLSLQPKIQTPFGRVVYNMISVFKQHYMHFYILFHPHILKYIYIYIYKQRYQNNITKQPLNFLFFIFFFFLSYCIFWVINSDGPGHSPLL